VVVGVVEDVVVVEPWGVDVIGDVVVAVVPGSVGTVGTVTGREMVGSVVVMHPTTGRQSCGAAGALLVNVPGTRIPAAKIPAPARTRAAVGSLLRTEVGRREVMASLFLSSRELRTVVNIGRWHRQQSPPDEAVGAGRLLGRKTAQSSSACSIPALAPLTLRKLLPASQPILRVGWFSAEP